jgi:uncharacterized membrane protein YeaQ/YmgE (transglycosylase-associated protein family)
MEILVWVLTGAAVGWLSFLYLRFNEARGRNVSIAIGVAGGLLGGKALAPMFTAVAAAPGDFSVPAFFFAATAALALLALANLLYVRWGV